MNENVLGKSRRGRERGGGEENVLGKCFLYETPLSLVCKIVTMRLVVELEITIYVQHNV